MQNLYQAKDGQLFSDPVECMDYEYKLICIEKIQVVIDKFALSRMGITAREIAGADDALKDELIRAIKKSKCMLKDRVGI